MAPTMPSTMQPPPPPTATMPTQHTGQHPPYDQGSSGYASPPYHLMQHKAYTQCAAHPLHLSTSHSPQ